MKFIALICFLKATDAICNLDFTRPETYDPTFVDPECELVV